MLLYIVIYICMYVLYVLIKITCITFASIEHISNDFLLCCGEYIIYGIYIHVYSSYSSVGVFPHLNRVLLWYDTYIHIWFYNWTGNNNNISTCGNCDMIKGIERVYFLLLVVVFIWFGLVCMRYPNWECLWVWLCHLWDWVELRA